MGMNDFDEWMNRPTYVVQCCTRRIAVEMFSGNAGMFRFRAKPAYRNDAARALRAAVALRVRELRRTGELTREIMRQKHAKDWNLPGEACRVDMEQEIQEMAERDAKIAAAVMILENPEASLRALTHPDVIGIQDVFPPNLVLDNKQMIEDLLELSGGEPVKVLDNPEGES